MTDDAGTPAQRPENITLPDLDNRLLLPWGLRDFARSRGLEVVPQHRTIAQREPAKEHYIDVAEQAGLRACINGDAAVNPIGAIPPESGPPPHHRGSSRSSWSCARAGSGGGRGALTPLRAVRRLRRS